MIDFIKQMMGITSSDEPNPNNQNLDEPQNTDYPEEYWTMLEKEWENFTVNVDEDELNGLMTGDNREGFAEL